MSTTDSKLTTFIDSLDHVPFELQRNFTLMRDLDDRAHSVMQEIDSMADGYLKSVCKQGHVKRKDQMSKIENLFVQARAFADDKVQIAFQSYELVDKHIQRLDSQLARIEADIQSKVNTHLTNIENKYQQNGHHKQRSQKRPLQKQLTNGGQARKKQRKIDPEPVSPGIIQEIISSPPAEVLAMPVDPNEPIFCFCRQVSYGEMIGCDNPDCPIEWFHFPCVGITGKPKGKWFCRKCIEERKKK